MHCGNRGMVRMLILSMSVVPGGKEVQALQSFHPPILHPHHPRSSIQTVSNVL